MDKKELLKDLKKVDLDLIKKSDIKMFQAEKMAVEYYNDAVDNIMEGNTDIAVIKLKKVLSLSPDFSEASQLLDRITEYENSHSIGDKVYESMHGRDVHAMKQVERRKNLPQILNIDPRILLKIIIVIVVIAITAAGAILLFNLFRDKPTDNKPEDNAEITYSQAEVQVLNNRIEALEASLAQSETETQEALSSSEDNSTLIQQLQSDNTELQALVELYKAAVLFNQEKYELSADIARTLKADDYKGDDKALYTEVYHEASFRAANDLYETGLSLYSQKDYAGAVEFLGKVDIYAPEFEELGNCYYVLAKAYYEIDNAQKSIELYKMIENMSSFENETGLLYYTAKAYQKLEQYEEAKALYNQLIADHPESSLVGHAKDRLREMP